MKATIVDLRYKMKDILKALDRKETVRVLYHGKLRANLVPAGDPTSGEKKVTDHPFFGLVESSDSVESTMKNLRGGRYRNI